MYVSLGLLNNLHNFRTAESQDGLFRCMMEPSGTTMAEILAEAAILDGALDELGKPEQTHALWSSCERLSQRHIAAGPTQVADPFQHVPIKVGRLIVDAANLREVDAVVTPRHLDKGEVSDGGGHDTPESANGCRPPPFARPKS